MSNNEKKAKKLRDFRKKTRRDVESFKDRKTKDRIRELREDLKNIMIESGASVNRSSMTKIKQQCEVMSNFLST